METRRWLPRFKSRVTENTFLHLPRAPVVVGLLVRACRNAIAPAPTTGLVNEYHAIFLTLVCCRARAGSNTGRIGTVIANAWQIDHKGVLVLKHGLVSLFTHVGEIVIPLTGHVSPSGIVLPINSPFNGNILLASHF